VRFACFHCCGLCSFSSFIALPIATFVTTAITSLLRDIPFQRRSAHAFQTNSRFALPALDQANSRFHIFIAYTPLGEIAPGWFVKTM
jgi:hypothetical protein